MQLPALEPRPLDLDAVVGEWAGQLRVFPNAAFAPRSDIGALVDAAAQAFPGLGGFDLEQFKLGACFFSDGVVGYDDVLDYTETRPAQVRDLLGVIPMQFESYRVFAQLLGDKPAFWSDLRRYFVEYLDAMHREYELKSNPAAWEACDELACLSLAARKNGLVRTIAAALCAASGDRTKLLALEQILVDIFVSYQMQDDVHDWREDLGTGHVSTVLRLACSSRPSPGDFASVARAIFLGGRARHVLLHGIALLDSVVPRARDLGMPGLLPLVAARRRMLASVLDAVEQEVRRAPARRVLQPAVPDVAAPLQEPLRAGLAFLAEHAARGFWETRHWIVLGDGWGTDLPSVVYGDVFTRAMVLDALCALRERGVERLDETIAAEADYLAGTRRLDALGGWSYLPDVQMLPPDADTTAQVLQALARAGRAGEALAQAEPALRLLFARTRDDGAYATWALPAPERSELDRRRYDIMASTFGLEPDVDVISNLGYALHAFASSAWAEQVSRSAAFVASAQQASRLWSGAWYEGPYYPTFAAVRFLCALAPAGAPTEPVAAAVRRLLLEQRADGGWGFTQDGDSLSTALAMSTLALVPPVCHDGIPSALQRGTGYLTGRRAADGGWEAVPFVRVFQGQAEQVSKSRCVTTAYVLRALVPARAR